MSGNASDSATVSFGHMWCSTCQQDVPALGSPASGGMRCGKCSSLFAEPEPVACVTESDPNAALKRVIHSAPLSENDWSLEAELRGVERLVSSLKSSGKLARQPLAIDSPHDSAAGWHAPAKSPTPLAPTAAEPAKYVAAWLILSGGLAVFACGAVLLGWSLLANRTDLWPIGMPLAIIGQAGLILGLVLQLDGLWQTSRKTAATLSELDGELKNVRQATTLLTTSRSSGSQTIYAHLAEGASPQMLLADLKGQLDLVAQEMAKRP